MDFLTDSLGEFKSQNLFLKGVCEAKRKKKKGHILGSLWLQFSMKSVEEDKTIVTYSYSSIV